VVVLQLLDAGEALAVGEVYCQQTNTRDSLVFIDG
jgi:hypothetical protein